MHPTLNLYGKWRYELDYQDKSIEEEWFKRELTHENFVVPGTTASNKIGTPVITTKELTKEAVKRLREEYKYLGAACYQTDFVLDNEFEQKRIELLMERVMFESTIWIDEKMIGKRDSLSTPHIYNITKYVEVGKKHTLTIRVDNRDIHKIGAYSSAYTDETQTIWNGMVGRVEITGQEEINIENVVVGLKAKERHLFLSFDADTNIQISNARIEVRFADGENVVATHLSHCDLKTRCNRIEIDFYLDESVLYWDEFSPKLYELKISIFSGLNGTMASGGWCGKIGLKEITAKDGILYLNGIQRFLRGNIDCCIYPLTAYPPMAYETWLNICNITKEYGLNHIRFHSWCPPEAAFQAADEVGLYLQVEGPLWMDDWFDCTVGSRKEHYTYLPEETQRIILTYSHHPSFCIFSNGNELKGDFDLLEGILIKLKIQNPYLLYTSSTNWDRKINSSDDVYIAQAADEVGCRGQYFLDKMVEGSNLCYEEAVKKRSVPIIAHEVGQYVVYPNVEEIPKYSGVLKAVNLESIKKDLVDKNLLSYVPNYVRASGKLAAHLYKAELEAALRTENFGGIQLLSLQDFPGQSTATVGLLDCFYDSKGIITAKEFRSFCNSTVLLVTMPKFLYLSKEQFKFELQLAHYGNEELKEVEVEITLNYNNDKKETFWTTAVTIQNVFIGLNKGLLNFNDNIFTELKGQTALTLTASIKSMDITNAWDIWVYEEEGEVTYTNCYEALDSDAVAKLEAGENIIILAKQDRINQADPGKFFPVFWSPVHFTSQDPCGMIIQNKHPLFSKYFLTKDYADVQWKNLLENSSSIKIDSLTSFEPMTMPVPNFFHNHKYTNLFEAKVLKGKVIVCSFDLSDTACVYPEIKSFKKALNEYYRSVDFCPTQTLDLEELQKLFKEKD